MNYFELHIGDYEKDTAHLSACEDGIYGRLLRRYYNTEQPLPLDVAAVQRLARAHSRDEKRAVISVLNEFFTRESDGWHHSRCDAELAKFQDKRDKAKASADARWSRRGGQRPNSERNANAYANASPEQCEGNATRARVPHTSSQTPESKAVDTSLSAELTSRAEALARALRRAGFEHCSAGHPEIIAAAEAGVTEAGMAEAAAGLVHKPVAYVARRAIGRLRDAQAAKAGGGGGATVVPLDPSANAERDWRLELEARIIDVRHQCDLGLLDQARRDEQIRDLQKQLADGWPGRREAVR